MGGGGWEVNLQWSGTTFVTRRWDMIMLIQSSAGRCARQNYSLWYSRNLFLKNQKWITDLSYMIQKRFQKKYWNFSDRIKNVELYTHFRNCALPPSGPDRAQRQQSKLITPQKFWHTNQDRIKNVELYTHFYKLCPPPLRARQGPKTTIKVDNSPKCLAHKSG